MPTEELNQPDVPNEKSESVQIPLKTLAAAGGVDLTKLQADLAEDAEAVPDDQASGRFEHQSKPVPNHDVAKQWYRDASNIKSRDDFLAFIKHVSEDYEHDYNSIVWAVAAGALAGAWAMNAEPQGGITGFQAGGVMWEFVRSWLHLDGPMRLVEYEKMLFPHYESRFKSISKDIFESLQKRARAELEDAAKRKANNETVNDVLVAHWQSIVDGTVPFGYTIEA